MEQYRDTDVVSMEVREITPAMASEMLGNNDGNRNLSQSKVLNYMRSMKEGSWRLTHQGIAVSDTGNVIDGQHRLAAIAQLGRPMRFVVITLRANDKGGELTAVAQPIDIGKRRSISDITEEPITHVKICRALIRDFAPSGNAKAQDPEIVARSIDLLRDELTEIKARCGTTRKGLSAATIQAIVVIRKHMGIDVMPYYKDALNQRYENLSRSWVSWSTRIEAMVEGNRVPKNGDFRKFLAAITWQVTDPKKDKNQRIVVMRSENYIDEISGVVQEILLPALTKKK